MSILRYSADKDNTISDAYKSDLSGTATGSNMGLADSLHIFSIYGQTSGSSGFSKELSRAIIKFPVTGTNSIEEDRDNGVIPASGSVSFYLNLYNAVTTDTLPKEFTINLYAIDQSWSEGDGLDMSVTF